MLTAPETVSSPLAESGLRKKALCDYVVNVATGCLHGCTFCYVPSTPVVRTRATILKDRGVENPSMDWGQYLFPRPDLPDQLDAVLRNKRNWVTTPAGKGVIMLSSGTDPYQNTEVAAITREVVKVCLKYDKRVRILTRSPLVVKDVDILVHPSVTVGFSVPTLDDDLSRAIEPKAPRPSDRLAAAQTLTGAGCRIYFAAAPVPPVANIDGSPIDFTTIYELATQLIALNPEVVFFECINPRGQNADRMRSAGLHWVDGIADSEDWWVYWFDAWGYMTKAFADLGRKGLLHPWPDKNLVRPGKTLQNQAIATWIGRPTTETWL